MALRDHSNKKVSYFYDNHVGNFYFGEKHPMKPHRINIAHELIVNYGLYQKMSVFKPNHASFDDLTQFHSEKYICFLKKVKPGNVALEMKDIMKEFKIGTKERDCPLFDGLFEFCQKSSGASIAAAAALNSRSADIAINWAGGLHHAKKSEASGFCYINDIVLAILELLKWHQRVLYIDIDVHHGDGVEEAFFTTDRVMTVSFHQFGKGFFPGTGNVTDIGAGKGKYYSLNVPLRTGMNDDAYADVFTPIMSRVMEVYRPSAIVLQCGADSLSGDRLGDFNLTLKGHGKCVDMMRKFNIPLMLLGGGGYTVRNVSRCWAYETAIALNTEISNDLPYNQYFNYFGPEHKLHIEPKPDLQNENTPEYLREVIIKTFEKLKMLQPAPSVQFTAIPGDFLDGIFQEQISHKIIPDNEFYDDINGPSF